MFRQAIVTGLMIFACSVSSFARSAPSCEGVFLVSRPVVGNNLGPVQWLVNLKLKMKSSKELDNFDEQKYQASFKQLAQDKPIIGPNYVPKTLEDYIAFLDVSLEELNLSILQMPPVIRHTIYKAVNKFLLAEGQVSAGDAQKISDLVIQGSYQKPTSFHFLLTHYPKETAAEMFTQALHKMVITQVVAQALNSNAPTSGLFPKWVRDHKEVLSLAVFSALDIGNFILSGSFVPVLNSLDVLQFKATKEKIQKSLNENGLERTLIQFRSEFDNKNQFNYYYAITEKALNWYFIGYVLAPLFF